MDPNLFVGRAPEQVRRAGQGRAGRQQPQGLTVRGVSGWCGCWWACRQVDEFLSEEIDPVLAQYSDLLAVQNKDEVKV